MCWWCVDRKFGFVYLPFDSLRQNGHKYMTYNIKHGNNKTLLLSFLIYFDKIILYNTYFISTNLTQQHGIWPL